MGVPIHREGRVTTVTGPAKPRPFELEVPGDPSAASAWLVAAALHPDAELTMAGVGLNPTRLALVGLLQRMGVEIETRVTGVSGSEPVGEMSVRGGSPLHAVTVDGGEVADLIDELPLIAIAMASVDEPSEVRDAAELRVKETDRIAAMVAGLRAIGADVEELDGRLARATRRAARSTDRHPWRPSDRDRLRHRRAHGSGIGGRAGRPRVRIGLVPDVLAGPGGGASMSLRRLRLLTAGESHGPGLSGILEGLPAGMRVSTRLVDRDLKRRQHGYGSGRRMQIERDRVRWTAGIRYGQTLGSPIGFAVDNRDWENWTERMSIEAIPADRRPKPITRARPGHVDLAGALKYDTDDVRDVLERASARSTTPRVVAGSLARQLLATCGVRIWSFVDQLGPVRAFPDADDVLAAIPDGWAERDLAEPSPLRCPDPDAERAMLAEVDAAKEAGDSIGGSFVVVVEGTPIGLGSSSEWDTRLDGLLAGATMAIPGVKGVEIGLGFGTVDRRGSTVHDVVNAESAGWARQTNRAGGIEGGISNGEPIVIRAAQKPVSTLRSPLPSLDMETGEPGRAHIERSDVTVLPRAAIVGEAMVALILADQLLFSFGGDTIGDLRAAVARRRRRTRAPRRS